MAAAAAQAALLLLLLQSRGGTPRDAPQPPGDPSTTGTWTGSVRVYHTVPPSPPQALSSSLRQ
jgi:hypothetical protein